MVLYCCYTRRLNNESPQLTNYAALKHTQHSPIPSSTRCHLAVFCTGAPRPGTRPSASQPISRGCVGLLRTRRAQGCVRNSRGEGSSGHDCRTADMTLDGVLFHKQHTSYTIAAMALWRMCNARTGDNKISTGGGIPGSAENGGLRAAVLAPRRLAVSVQRLPACPSACPVPSAGMPAQPHPYSCHALSLYGSLRRLLPPRLSGGLSRGGVEPGARRWPARAVRLGLGLGLALGLGSR